MTPDASFPLDPKHVNGSSNGHALPLNGNHTNGSHADGAHPESDHNDGGHTDGNNDAISVHGSANGQAPRENAAASSLAASVEETSGQTLSDQTLPVATMAPPNLMRRPVLRALIIAPERKALATRRVERFLLESGHAVRFERTEAFASEEGTQRALEVFESTPDDRPDVMLLDCGGDKDALETLCRRVRASAVLPRIGAQLMAVVPHNLLSRDPHVWDNLRGAGADMLLDADAPLPVVEAYLENGAQTARLCRELRGARDQLARHQQVDEVTGLLNRRFFFQAAYREVSRARRYGHPLACLMLEVDHLVHFNESYGYSCGDGILKTMATLLRAWTRDSDIVARFAGTKMVLLLPETPVEGAVGLREKLQRVVEDTPFSWEGHALPVTLSIGEAERPASLPEPRPGDIEAEREEEGSGVSVREELADLLADADAALYVAKRGARTPAAFVEYTAAPEESEGKGLYNEDA